MKPTFSMVWCGYWPARERELFRTAYEKCREDPLNPSRHQAVHTEVELSSFVDRLSRLDAEDVTAVALAIEASHQTAADEVAAWEDLMRIDDAIRSRGRSRAAANAAHEAVVAVRRAVAASDEDVPETLVTRVAREAALLARALVAEADEPVAHLEFEFRCLISAA